MTEKSELRTTSELLSDAHGVNNDDWTSSAPRSSSTTSKTSGDDEARYGCWRSHPRWLQPLNNIVGFIAFASLANCMQSLSNGLLGVVLSTLERHFDLSSSASSWIASSYEIGQIPVLVAVSLLGTRIHRPRATAAGLLTICLGCVTFFVPQFTTPAYRPTDQLPAVDGLCASGNGTSTCGRRRRHDPGHVSTAFYLPVFMASRLLVGMGSSPIVSVGVTYIDDCSTKEKFATYAGVFNAMSIVGPALGYVFGAMSLKIFTDFYVFTSDEVGIDRSDPRWVGAWWLPYTVTASLCLLIAIPLMGYPHDLPGAAEIRAKKVTEAHKDQLTVVDGNGPSRSRLTYAKTPAEYGALAKGVFSNPTFWMLSIFSSCLNFFIAGFSAFGPKYFEFGFSMTPSVAGIVFGVVLLPAGAGGTIIGGLLIEKLQLHIRQIFRIQIFMSCLITASCVLFLLICDTTQFAGVTVPYNTFSSAVNLTNHCNANCSCAEVHYEPICSHDHIQYYSPCHAGCLVRRKTSSLSEFFNCSCIPSSNDVTVAVATAGVCSAGVCTAAVLFIVAFFVAVVAICICITTNMAATLRCVSSSQTVFAFGIQILIVKVLGTVPGPLLMGVIFDRSCTLWRDDCGAGGSCMFYDNGQLSLGFLGLCVGVSGASLAAMVVAVACYRAPTAVNAVVVEVNGNGGTDKDAATAELTRRILFQTDF